MSTNQERGLTVLKSRGSKGRVGVVRLLASRAGLVIERADWHILRRWDVLIEGRRLELVDAEKTRSGALLGICHYVGDHIKLGVG